MLIEHKYKQLTESVSKLSLTFTGSENWPVWDRFISYDGEQLLHLGNICGTCAFFFHQINEPVKQGISIEETRSLLNAGVLSLDDELIDKLAQLMPIGDYEVSLFQINPYQTKVNGDKDYFKEEQAPLWYGNMEEHSEDLGEGMSYYRGEDKVIDVGTSFYELLVPIYQPNYLDEERVLYYQEQIRAGYKPTVVSLGMFEIREALRWFAEDDDDTEYHHAYLMHYLLDGHHKIQAAARESKPITLISFVQKDKAFDVVNKIVKIYDDTRYKK